MQTTLQRLRIIQAVTLVLSFLLTPLAFEPRPLSTIHLLGRIALGFVFATNGVNIASLYFAGKNPRRAALLAMAGPFLFLVGFIIEQAGLFADSGPPPIILALEIAWLVCEVIIFGLARSLLGASPAK